MNRFTQLVSGPWLRVLAGFLLISAVFAGAVMAQASYSGRVIDLNSPLSHDILDLLAEHCPSLQTTDWENITREVQLAAADYGLEPALLLALMVGEESYPRYAQARLYYFNLDMGSLAGAAVLPVAWFDSERVARAYAAEYERYEDPAAAVAAYFAGRQALPPDGDMSSLSQGMIDLVGMVLTLSAEWSHLGERGGPQVIEPDEDTPESAFIQPVYDLTEIERGYIDNMKYFNSRLDDATAREIFDAIRVHAESYQTVDARLVMALVGCESSFRPDAVSRCGAEGLGQLMPFTSERFGVEDPFDIDENIRATFAYLERELERWSGYNYRLDRVLAAYNAGHNAVERYNGIPPYEETINYVRKVVNYYYWMLPEEERAERIAGQSRHYSELVRLYGGSTR